MDNIDFCSYVKEKLFFDCAKYINSAAALCTGIDPKAAVREKSDVRPAVVLCIGNSYPL